jgi:hypothetical protein
MITSRESMQAQGQAREQVRVMVRFQLLAR